MIQHRIVRFHENPELVYKLYLRHFFLLLLFVFNYHPLPNVCFSGPANQSSRGFLEQQYGGCHEWKATKKIIKLQIINRNKTFEAETDLRGERKERK